MLYWDEMLILVKIIDEEIDEAEIIWKTNY
jgi:hypothetical protein